MTVTSWGPKNNMAEPSNTVHQCKSCPWRVDSAPDRDIPGYSRDLHKGLVRTIASGLDFRLGSGLRCMACHYSKPGEEAACAGWLHHQLGIGNNIGVRLAVISGRLPRPEIDGDQHACFEDTMTPQTEEAASDSHLPTLPQTICLLAYSRDEQPRMLPPITRAHMLTRRWIVLVEKRQPGSKGKTRFAITEAGREALERSKHLDEAKRKLERGRHGEPWL